MPTKPQAVELPRFAGLDLRRDPQELQTNGAVDLLNVDFGTDGRLVTRAGYAKFPGSAGAQRYTSIGSYETSGGTKYLYAHRSSSPDEFIDRIDTSGVVTTVRPATPANPTLISDYAPFVRYGTPTTEYLFFSQGGIGIYGLTGLANEAGAPQSALNDARFLAVQQPDNRLVAGRPNSSRVEFSDAGNPFAVSANNYVDLYPGDGEILTGLASYGNLLIAFKKTKYFVFYGNTTDVSGNAVFNFRAVDSGIGCEALRGVAVGRQGVFFINSRGVYVTTGGQPTLVSEALDPLFTGASAPYLGISAINQSSLSGTSLHLEGERLYVSVPTGSSTYNDKMLVLDLISNTWTIWDIPAGDMCSWRVTGGKPELFFTYPTGTNDIGRINTTYTTDAGTAIAARYRPGFWNPGQPGSEAWIREILLDGTGTVTVKTAVNDATTLGTGVAVTLGTAPAIVQGRDRRGVRARNVSYEFSGTAPWSLSRATALLWGQTSPGAKAA